MTSVGLSAERGNLVGDELQAELQRSRSQIAALEQLLEVHEQTSLEQATRLERLLEERSDALERERAARARLTESEERLRLALDAGRMGTWEWDIPGGQVMWSPEEERLYGLAPGTFSGGLEEYRRRIHPGDREQSLALVEDALARRAPTHHITHRILRADGEVRWLESHGRFLFGEDGSPRRLVGVSTDVTDRLEMEAARDRALAEARIERARLYEVFMQAPAAITVLEGPDHVFSVVNPLYRELIGDRDVQGKTVREALPELRGQGFYELLDRVFESGQPFSAHESLVRLDRDGDGVPEDVFIDFVYQPLKTADGRVAGIMAHAVDTTDRVLARRRIEALATERTAILGQIADVVITTDDRGNLSFFNEAARTLYGELRTGLPIWDEDQPFQLLRVDGTRKPTEEVPLYRALRDERVTNEEWRVRRPDETEILVLGSAVPLRDAQGTLIGAAMTVRDVTEQRTLQQQVEYERSQLRHVLMQAPAAISVTEGPEHVIVMQNDVARQLIGGRDVVGRRTQDVLGEMEAAPFVELQDIVYRTGVPYVGREVLVRFDRAGEARQIDAYFNFVYQPLRNLRGEVYGILSHAVEVTDQVLARQLVEEKAEQLARLSQELEQSNRELDQFAYVASHDLKAPLRGIANLTQWIEEDLGDRVTGESREHMQLLKGRVHRMEALIDGILAYSRAGRVREKFERVDVGALLSETIELLAPPGDAQIFVEPPMPVIDAERVPLQQIFMNLIGNALKYSGRSDARIVVRAVIDDATVRFSVSDNGPGIAPQFQEKVWQIFQTLAPRDKVEGTGIGLSVVRKLVESRGGRVWLESTPGEGSTFSFTWPNGQGVVP